MLSLELEAKQNSRSKVPEDQKTGLKELVFKERQKRSKQTYLPENDNNLTLT